MTPAPGSKVFISYSHKDKAYLDRLQEYLTPYVRSGAIPLWDDTQIKPGDDWYEEIKTALASASVAILLVSVSFLASTFVAEEELPNLLTAAKERGLVILPVVVTPCLFWNTPLSRFQAINDPVKPLSGLAQYEQDRIWERVVESVQKALNVQRPIASSNPYPGLLPFRADRAQHFHGRDIEKAELVDLITKDQKRLILIFGASGAGKSSLVWAGVVPVLERRGWKTIICHPRQDAFDSLVSALCNEVVEELLDIRLHISSKSELCLQLRKNPALIKDVLSLASEGRGWRPENGVLVFIDQFEELFTLASADSDVPPAFMNLIKYIASAEEELPTIHLIFTMRSEYLEQLTAYVGARLIKPYLVGLPDQSELRQMVEKPIADAGMRFENPRLPQIIVKEVEKETSALVLISFIMEKLYTRCAARGLLTDEAYNQLGGVKGAISELGEQYLQQHKDHAEPIMEVFSRLIQFVPVQNTPTRRPVRLQDFSPEARAVINDLSGRGYRLLSIRTESDAGDSHRSITGTLENMEQEVQGGVPVVEIAHEAIISNWAYLKEVAEKNEEFYRSEAELEQLLKLVESGSVRGKPSDLDRYLKVLQGQGNPELKKTFAGHIKDLVDAIFQGLEKEISPENTTPDRRKDIGRELAEMVEKLRLTDIPPPVRKGVYVLSDKTHPEQDNLPDIDWRPVAGGTVTIKTKARETQFHFDVGPFEIAPYPITVWQYQAFLEAEDGYKDKEHRWWQWTKKQVGRKYWRDQEMRSEKQGNCPVRGVLWYNAVAFCHWLTAKYRQMGELDKDHVIRLPTEWEWQCAALGPEVPGKKPYMYPWGTDWEVNRANTSECDLREEIAVGMFPSTSPSGAEDMFGNVAEWCLNSDEPTPGELLLTDQQRRVLRGASYAIEGQTSSAFEWRVGRTPDQSEKWAGFRVVKALPVQF